MRFSYDRPGDAIRIRDSQAQFIPASDFEPEHIHENQPEVFEMDPSANLGERARQHDTYMFSFRKYFGDEST